MWEHFSESARVSVFVAQNEAERLHVRLLGPWHLATGCLAANGQVQKLIDKLQLDESEFLAQWLELTPPCDEDITKDFSLSPVGKKCIDRACRLSGTLMNGVRCRKPFQWIWLSKPSITTLTILFGCGQVDSNIGAFLTRWDITLDRCKELLDDFPKELDENPGYLHLFQSAYPRPDQPDEPVE